MVIEHADNIELFAVHSIRVLNRSDSFSFFLFSFFFLFRFLSLFVLYWFFFFPFLYIDSPFSVARFIFLKILSSVIWCYCHTLISLTSVCRYKNFHAVEIIPMSL